MARPRCQDSSEVKHQRPKSGPWSNSWNSPPLPQNSWDNPPTSESVKLASPWKLSTPRFQAVALALCNGSHSVCGECFSMNKSTSYPSLCLSLDSFCDETSRTWAFLCLETRSVISAGRPWVLAGFESQHNLRWMVLAENIFLSRGSILPGSVWLFGWNYSAMWHLTGRRWGLDYHFLNIIFIFYSPSTSFISLYSLPRILRASRKPITQKCI